MKSGETFRKEGENGIQALFVPLLSQNYPLEQTGFWENFFHQKEGLANVKEEIRKGRDYLLYNLSTDLIDLSAKASNKKSTPKWLESVAAQLPAKLVPLINELLDNTSFWYSLKENIGTDEANKLKAEIDNKKEDFQRFERYLVGI